MSRNVEVHASSAGRRWRRFAVVNVIVALVLSFFAAMPGEPAAADTPVHAGVLVAGDGHTCGLTPSGAADCWGDNSLGQGADRSGPYTQLAAGVVHTCGLTPAGAADCWGDNSLGQAADQPGPYIQLVSGYYHTCGLTPTGDADCWGDNHLGKATDQTGPFTQLATGGAQTCGLTQTGVAVCWGSYDIGPAADQIGPYTQLVTGVAHTCGLTPTGGVDCWDYNGFGHSDGPFTQLAAGGLHTCALTPAGSAFCWGNNDRGQADNQLGPYTQLAAGWVHTCGLTATGAADCWGYNYYGQSADQVGPYAAPTPCPPGSFSASGMAPCTPAPAGYYVEAIAAQGATPAPIGTYVAGTGATSPTACPPGTTTLFVASASADACVSPDSTPPTIGYSVNGGFPAVPDGDNGWYVGDVTLDWTVAEEESPDSLILTGCVDVTITTDQPATDASCAASSDGGNAGPVVVSIARDATAPSVVWAGGPADGSTFVFGSVPAAPTCSAVDSLSGEEGCTVSGYSTSVGAHTLTAIARDRAGNVTEEQRSYTVLPYTLAGFAQPVDMGSVLNTVKSGSTVPFKFEVFAGATELTDVAVVSSFTWANISCTAVGAVATEDAIEQVTSGNTTLRYDTTAGLFVQNWQTPKNRAGACFRVTMTTVDGSSLVAYFKLK